MGALGRQNAWRGAFAVFSPSSSNGHASGARGVCMKRQSSFWVFVVHRLSGIGLALFLPFHFWALGRGLELDAFLAWTQQPLVKFAEWGLVVLLAAHLGGGVRVLAPALLPWWRR